ncbi:MAG TPA: ribonuclease H-like domain-containing protein [Candidatus Acidoferrales bacterium]
MSLREKISGLAALRPAKGRGAAAKVTSAEAASSDAAAVRRGFSPSLPHGAEALAARLEGKALVNSFGEHLSVRKWFSEAIGFAAPEGEVNADALRLLAPDGASEMADPSQWLFLDTETTGLMGGTGTYPFMVGIAWWDAGGLEVEQFFMRDYHEEHALLVTLAERLAERRVLVTFNGKSFDWPLLETRYKMTRKIPAPTLRGHLDFLHPARNLWRIRLGSVRLAELEKHVLGWDRGADLISAMIPQFYFDYLRGGSPEPLVQIFLHNQMDLRGLAGLASRILSILAAPEAAEQDGLELFGVSRICERRGEMARARKHYAESIAAELPPETDRVARRSLARLAKRDGDFPLALELWESIRGNSREGLEAYEQLAMHYERRGGDTDRATVLVREALAELRKTNRAGLISAAVHRQYRERFERRLARLGRAAGPADGSRQALLETMEAESRGAEMESNGKRRRSSYAESG